MSFWILYSNAQYFREIDSLTSELKKPLNDSIRIDILNDLGGYEIQTRNYERSLNYLFEAQKQSEKINYKNGLSNALHRIGILYMNKNSYAEATNYYQKALQLKKEISDKKGMADVTSNMGVVDCDQGDYASALEKYFSALKIREEIKDWHGNAISLMSIANIYYLKSDYETALDYYFQALKIKDIEKHQYFIAETQTNIGMTYLQLKDYKKAESYYLSSMKIDEEMGDKQGIAIAKTNLAGIYAIRKEYQKAVDLLNEARRTFENIEDKKNAAETYYELGNIFDTINELPKAIECYTKQLSLSREINSKVNIKNAYEGLSRISQKKHDYKTAHEFFKLYKAMEDSIQTESGNKTIVELEAKYQSQKKEKEITILKKEQELKDAENQQRTQLILGSIIIGIAVSITLLLLYNSKQLKKKNVLEKKNFELERNALANQMNPHFIFNSLGSISGFVAENEKDKAIEYLGVFSKLIRHNLEQSREQLVSVNQEAEMLKLYLYLQQLRFDNKFTFEVTLSEAIDSTIALPPMFVQPYVENAILHGVIPKEGKGNILVKFTLSNSDELICEVSDDGIGMEESKNRKSVFDTKQKSLAMTIAQERKDIINSKNKQKIQILVSDSQEINKTEGTVVKLIFPLEYV